MVLIIASALIGFIALLGLVAYWGLFQKDKSTEGKTEEDENESSEQQSKQKKKKENKLGRSRKGSQSVHHPMFATELKGHTRNVVDMDFDINGKFVVTASEDRSVRLWTTKTLLDKEHKSFRTNFDFDSPTKVKFSPDGKAFIVAMDMKNVLFVYKLRKEGNKVVSEEALEFPMGHDNPIIALDMSSGGRFIMSCCEQKFIVWSLRGDILATVDTHMVPNSCAVVSPCGKLIACTGFTSDVKIWEVQFSREGSFSQVGKVLDLGAHKAAVQCVSFSGNSEKVATLSKDGTWILWNIGADIKKGDSPKVLFTADLPVKSSNPVLKISPDGHVIAIGLSSTIYIYSGTDGEVLEVLDAVHHGSVVSLVWSPDNQFLLSVGGGERHIRVWYNIPGLKIAIRELEDKRPEAKGNEVYKKRLEEQISQAREHLAKLESHDPAS